MLCKISDRILTEKEVNEINRKTKVSEEILINNTLIKYFHVYNRLNTKYNFSTFFLFFAEDETFFYGLFEFEIIPIPRYYFNLTKV